jgi:nucleoside-diphosphate-sugar epimerase
MDLASGCDPSFQPDVVLHAAARSSPWGTRQEFARQNVTATRNVVEFCERHGRPLLVHLSTSAVMYTNSHQYRLNERSPLPDRAINTYAATKRESEQIVQAYQGPSCIVRPRAVFGPGDTVVFPRILRAAKSGRLPLIESDEAVMGDLIYIDTLVDYLVRIVDRRATGLYLLTNNQPVPILDFLQALFARLDLPPLRRRIPVSRAMAFASALEMLYRIVPVLGEPPLTRFGVSVFAYSKTFDVAKALADLGPPSVALEDGVSRFVESLQLSSAP